MLKGYKFRIYPTSSQEELINKHIGCSRFVYNLALETKRTAYIGAKKNLSCFDLNKQLPELKKECPWLKEVNSQSLQQAIVNLDSAYNLFFKGIGAFPKFKSKYIGRSSFQAPQFVYIDSTNNKLILPKFKDGIKIVLHRPFQGKIKTVTITKTPTGKFIASILVDTNIQNQTIDPINPSSTVGIDLGITSFLTLSTGEKVSNPRFLKSSLSHLKYLQRKLSRKRKGSASRKKALLKVTKQHEKIFNSRQDFLHKLSIKLVRENQTICLEDLNITKMLQNHTLAQSISDCSWGTFVFMLQYKSLWYGTNLIKIGRFDPSTKTCSTCGTLNHNLTLSDRVWKCSSCETIHDRDINAAINIKKFALKKHLSGEPRLKNQVELPTMVGAMKPGVTKK